jgi:pimeloyl-ACP methyl ester carboxylesterase
MADAAIDGGTTAATRGMVDRLVSAETKASSPHIVDELQKMIDATAPSAVAAAQRGMADRSDASDLLPLLKFPTLFICGEDDQITPAAEMALMAKAVPGSRTEIIPAAGHMAPMEQPDLTNQVIDEFMKRAAAGEPSQ